MISDFQNARNQDAAPVIRGFLYQVYQTIYLWLQLKEGEWLEVEKGEDVDIVQANSNRNLIQVKDLTAKITLRTPAVSQSLFNYYQHRKMNPDIRLKFCFLTTATPTKEQGYVFSKMNSGIEEWGAIQEGLVKSTDKISSITTIKEILLSAAIKLESKQAENNKAAWQKWINYLKEITSLDFEEFIKAFYFQSNQLPINELRNEIGFALVRKNKAKFETVNGVSNTILAYVFDKISKPGLKKLTIEEINECLQCESSSQLLDIKRRIEDLEQKLSNNNTLVQKQLQEYSDKEGILSYKESVKSAYKDWNIPQEVIGWGNISTKKFSPKEIHRFREKILNEDRFSKSPPPLLRFDDLMQFSNSRLWLFIGDTGLGKTAFLKFLTYEYAATQNQPTPIYIPLRKVSEHFSLKQLIVDEFNRNDYPIKEEQLYNLLKKDSFILLLDAYDEVDKSFRKSLNEEVFRFSERLDIIITTRPNSIPRLPKTKNFELQPLEYETMKNVIIEYIGEASYYDFIKQMEQHGLLQEARNILLLLLFIAVFKKHEYVPNSNAELIETIVFDIFDWAQSKNTDKDEWFTKKIIGEILQHLAYQIFDGDNQTSLSEDETDKYLCEYITKKQQLKQIPNSLIISNLKEKLAQLGIIVFTKNGETFFWHRLFLNHFAALSFAKKYINNEIDLSQIKNQYKWVVPLANCTAHLSSSKQVKYLLEMEDNLWMVAEGLANTQNLSNETLINQIISKLKSVCFSPIMGIKMQGVYYLRLLNQRYTEYTKPIFWELFQKSTCIEVRRRAFIEIAKEKTIAAKKLVFDNIEWNDASHYNYFIGTRQEVFKALSYYDEKGYWKMYEISIKTKHGHYYGFDRIFSELIIFNKLPDDLIDEMFDSFLQEQLKTEEENFEFNSLELRPLLQKIRKDKWVIPLIDCLKKAILNKKDGSLYRQFDIIELLGSYQSVYSLDLLWKAYNLENTSTLWKIEIATIIAKHQGNVPLHYFITFIEEDEEKCKIQGIKGLRRFRYSEIQVKLKSLLIDNSHAIHHLALTISLEAGFFPNLINDGFITKEYLADCNKRIDVFLKAIIRHHLDNQIDTARDFLKNNNANRTNLFYYLKALSTNNFNKRLIDIFKKNYYHENGEIFLPDIDDEDDMLSYQENLLKIIILLPSEEGSTVLNDLYERLIETDNLLDISNFFDKFRTNGIPSNFKGFLKKIISKTLSKADSENYKTYYHVNSYLLTLSNVIQYSDEGWLVEICDNYYHINSNISKRLMQIIMKVAKTSISLDLSKKIALQLNNKTSIDGDDIIIMDSCYEIQVNYYRKNGILKQIKIDELFESDNSANSGNF